MCFVLKWEVSPADLHKLDLRLLQRCIRARPRQIHDLADVPEHVRREIEYFFAIYKDLEGKPTAVSGWRDAAFARAEVERARRAASR